MENEREGESLKLFFTLCVSNSCNDRFFYSIPEMVGRVFEKIERQREWKGVGRGENENNDDGRDSLSQLSAIDRVHGDSEPKYIRAHRDDGS